MRSGKCVECGTEGPSTAHHFKGDFWTGRGKAPDLFAVPLCVACHRAFHETMPKMQRRNKQRLWLLLTIYDAIENGQLVPAGRVGPGSLPGVCDNAGGE